MEKVRPWCGQPSDRGRLKNRNRSYIGHKHIQTVVLESIVFVNETILASTRSSAIAEGPRDASCQSKSCQLPRNSAETTSPDQIDGMKLEI